MAGAHSPLEVLSSPEEEEKGDPGEVAYGNVMVCCSLIGSVQSLDDVDGEGPHLGRRRLLFLIGRQFLYQAKVDFPHVVVSWVIGLH